MRFVGSMLNVHPAATVISTCPQLGVEGVQDLDIEAGERL
jgi:hypothetical protein